MSKKYKLIKEYPNSPKLGSIIIDINPVNGAKDCWYDENWCKAGVKSFLLPKSTNPENHPEFWELVKEKEWEIISKSTFVKGYLTHVGGIELVEYINAIKRLSDDTIFSIGYKIKCINSHVDKPEAITKIQLNKEETPCLFTSSFSNNGVSVFKATKCDKLFTTEDSVDIYKGDIYWFVNIRVLTLSRHRADGQYLAEDVLRFSTKQKAEEYIAKSKPILTTEDGVDIFEGDDSWHVDNYFGIGKGYLKENEFNPLIKYKHFSTEKAAKDWIKMNKPKYSMNDLINCCENMVFSHGKLLTRNDADKLQKLNK